MCLLSSNSETSLAHRCGTGSSWFVAVLSVSGSASRREIFEDQLAERYGLTDQEGGYFLRVGASRDPQLLHLRPDAPEQMLDLIQPDHLVSVRSDQEGRQPQAVVIFAGTYI